MSCHVVSTGHENLRRLNRRSGAEPCTLPARVIALLLLAVMLPRGLREQPPPLFQADVQAVYIFDFAKFVRWPAGSDQGPLVICVAAPKVYADTLSKIVAGENIAGRGVAVRSVQTSGDTAGCSILFVDVSAKDRLTDLLAATSGKPVLTVSDIPGFLDRGGMVQFVTIDNRVRFSIALGPAARGNLSLSSQLLKVAVKVSGKPGNGGEHNDAQ